MFPDPRMQVGLSLSTLGFLLEGHYWHDAKYNAHPASMHTVNKSFIPNFMKVSIEKRWTESDTSLVYSILNLF
jgi:hypothetical protein